MRIRLTLCNEKSHFLFNIFSLLALPALAELTDVDLNKICLIVNEEVEKETTRSEKNIKEHINIKIDSVKKQLSMYNWVIYVLMPLIVAAIGIPTTIMAWRSEKDRSLERQCELKNQTRNYL